MSFGFFEWAQRDRIPYSCWFFVLELFPHLVIKVSHFVGILFVFLLGHSIEIFAQNVQSIVQCNSHDGPGDLCVICQNVYIEFVCSCSLSISWENVCAQTRSNAEKPLKLKWVYFKWIEISWHSNMLNQNEWAFCLFALKSLWCSVMDRLMKNSNMIIQKCTYKPKSDDVVIITVWTRYLCDF